MEISVFTVDAFTNQPFKGNPAAVCLLPHALRDELYQKIAVEMNLSETAFIMRLNSVDDFTSASRFGLRWFTPTNEVPLCGHATLASAAVLFYRKKNLNAALVFETLSGELCVRLHGDSIVMDFPLNKPVAQDPNEVKDLIKATVGGLSVQDVCYCAVTKKLLICLSDSCDRSLLTSLQPDSADLLHSESSGRVKGVIITWKGPLQHSLVMTSSLGTLPLERHPRGPGDRLCTHCACWILVRETGEEEDAGLPVLRPGELDLALRSDGRVDISGHAVIILQGTLML